MSDITIYHNPRCSKSRETLALLNERGLNATVVEYLTDTPNADALRDIVQKLGLKARDLLRTKEDEYKSLGLNNPALTDDDLINTMVAHPKLIERPIVVHGNQARIGRPPETVLEILP